MGIDPAMVNWTTKLWLTEFHWPMEMEIRSQRAPLHIPGSHALRLRWAGQRSLAPPAPADLPSTLLQPAPHIPGAQESWLRRGDRTASTAGGTHREEWTHATILRRNATQRQTDTSSVVLAPFMTPIHVFTDERRPISSVSVQDSRVSKTSSSVRVLIVDDDPFTRTVLRSVIDSPPIEVVDVVGTFALGISSARVLAPDVALIDLDLGEGPTGIDLAHGLRRLLPNIGIVMLSTYVDPRLLGTGTDLPLGGIYLTKQEVADTAILHNALMSASSKPRGVGFAAIGDERIDNLTDSQIEVMRLIAAGFSNAEIARRLVIEEASVEKSVMRLIRQLDVKATHIENQRVMITQAYFALSGTRNVRRA